MVAFKESQQLLLLSTSLLPCAKTKAGKRFSEQCLVSQQGFHSCHVGACITVQEYAALHTSAQRKGARGTLSVSAPKWSQLQFKVSSEELMASDMFIVAVSFFFGLGVQQGSTIGVYKVSRRPNGGQSIGSSKRVRQSGTIEGASCSFACVQSNICPRSGIR